MREAERLFDEADAMAGRVFGEGSDVSAIASVFRAETLYERNDLEEAQAVLAWALPHVEKYEGWFDLYDVGYAISGALTRIRHGVHGAEEVYRRGQQMAEDRRLDRLSIRMSLQHIRDLLLSKDLDRARARADDIQLAALYKEASDGDVWSRRIREATGATMARLALAEGDGEGALGIVTPLYTEAKKHIRMRRVMELQAVRASAYWRLGVQDQALEALDEALSLAVFEGFRRIFIDEGEPLLPVIEGGLLELRGGTNRRKDALMKELAAGIKREARELNRVVGDGTLSRRELEVLRLVAKGYSNKEVARAVDISERTVKFHLSNIFTKFDVTTRKEAVREAGNRSLL
ncbi:MAG: LuxR C-terminal-related transcriptional regulator [Caulobacterales bacterium]|nr:LuxR C-terminal-related transcriptional regulator [Caulobacterales bacterium]